MQPIRKTKTLVLLAVTVLLTALIAAAGFSVAKSEPAAQAAACAVRISEIQASNAAFPDSDGVLRDWVELYNESSQPYDLSGCGLSDDALEIKYFFPAGTLMKAGERLVTSLVILAVSSNVVLSLGMVGALSIVRFRTAVKDVMDTVFMFWAIASGIITGAGYMVVAIIATAVVGLLFVVVCLARQAVTAQSYMLIIRCSAETELDKALTRVAPYRVRSKTLSADAVELVAELRLGSRNFKKAEALAHVPGIEKVDIVSYNGDTLL